MTTAGPNNPSTVVEDTSVGTLSWTDPGNAKTTDGNYASTSDRFDSGVTHYLKATGFGFSAIPDTATITGLSVDIVGMADGTQTTDDTLKWVIGGTISGASLVGAGNTWTDSTLETHTYSGLGGLTLTGADVNTSDFGCVYSASVAFSFEFDIDSIAVTVTYTPAVTTSTRTITPAARLKATLTRTLTPAARLMATLTRTITPAARLKQNFTRTITPAARLSGSLTRIITPSARLRGTFSRTITPAARLTFTAVRTITASARLKNVFTRTIAPAARLAAQVTRTITPSARLRGQISRTISPAARLKIVSTRTGQRSGTPHRSIVTLRLHSPLPEAHAFVPLRFNTPQTSLVITTSIERGYESCQIGFPQRDGAITRRAWLQRPVLEYADYGHAVVADGSQILFAGRTSQAPQFVGGQIRAVTAQGYWDALNDGYFESSDETVTTTGAVIEAVLTQLMPYARVDKGHWDDPAIPHAPSEGNGQRGGQFIDSLLKEGNGNGVLVDLQFWADQTGAIIVQLVSRLPPLVPDYEIPWYDDPQVVNLSYDPSQLYSHVRARYTPDGGNETVTDWQPALSDTRFLDVNGFQRMLEIASGQKTEAGAKQLRDTTQALHSVRQWGGSISPTVAMPLFYAGSNLPVPHRVVRAGQWVRVHGLDALLQIQRTRHDVTPDTLDLSVTQGITRRSLQQRIVDTMGAVRTGRNPVSGAKAS